MEQDLAPRRSGFGAVALEPLRERTSRKASQGGEPGDHIETTADYPSVRRKWYYKTLGEVCGPVSSRRLWKLAQRQDVNPDTFVRKGRKGDWVLAEKVHGLFDPHFGDRFADHHHEPVAAVERVAAAGGPEDETAARDAVHLIRFREEIDHLRRRVERRTSGSHIIIAVAGAALTVVGVLGLSPLHAVPWNLLAIEPQVQAVVAAVLTGAGLTMSTVGVLLLAGVLRDS